MRTTFLKFILLTIALVLFSCSTNDNTNESDASEEMNDQIIDESIDESIDDEVVEGPEPNPEVSDVIWSDEFNGDALDETKWRYQRGGWNGASNVQNCYVDENTAVSDGVLQITAKYEPGFDCFNVTKDFTSGFVQTKDKINWTYGYFEAKVRVPASNSTWPAFWMSPQDNVYGEWPQSGEIDIFEIKGHDMTKSYGNAHWGNSRSDKRQEKGKN